MPERDHLRRLTNVWVQNPIYFVTACTSKRRPILTTHGIPDLLVDSWNVSPEINGWVVGRYVIMPDHVHFFATPRPEAKLLSYFVRDWKKWTARRITEAARIAPPVWQAEFFDHVLRSAKSYGEKWDYVRENPVRAGLAASAEAWPFAGECAPLRF